MKFYVNFTTEEHEVSYTHQFDTLVKAERMAAKLRRKGLFCWVSNYAH